jgi:hypothetical protein
MVGHRQPHPPRTQVTEPFPSSTPRGSPEPLSFFLRGRGKRPRFRLQADKKTPPPRATVLNNPTRPHIVTRIKVAGTLRVPSPPKPTPPPPPPYPPPGQLLRPNSLPPLLFVTVSPGPRALRVLMWPIYVTPHPRTLSIILVFILIPIDIPAFILYPQVMQWGQLHIFHFRGRAIWRCTGCCAS